MMKIEITDIEAKLILSTIKQRKMRVKSEKGLKILNRLEKEINERMNFNASTNKINI